MATSQSNKRHKTGTCTVELEASYTVGDAINSILNVDREAFKDHARTLDWKTFTLISNRLSELRQDMEDTLTKFADIPPIVIASNVFPFLENRTDWNNFAFVNKDINYAVTNHKELMPPWPEGKLADDSLYVNSVLRAPTFSPDGKFIANGDLGGNLYLWNRTKGLVANWKGHDHDNEDYGQIIVDDISFSPAGNVLVTVGNYSNIKIWDLANDNRCLREWTQDHVSSVVFSPDGKYIATAGGLGEPVYLRNVSDGTNARLIRPTLANVNAVTFSPDGLTLAFGGFTENLNGSVELWNLDSAEDTFTNLEGDLSSSVWALIFCPNGTFLAVTYTDGTIKLWDVATNRCVHFLEGHTGSVTSISFTSDGSFLISGGVHRTIRTWFFTNTNTNTNGNCIELIKSGVFVSKVEFSRDGQMLLTKEGFSICLRRMDTYMLESLKDERADLMKVTTKYLEQALTENKIPFASDSTSVSLVDLLVQELDQNQRKMIIARYNNGALCSPARL
jgi:WD40 repeat protein